MAGGDRKGAVTRRLDLDLVDEFGPGERPDALAYQFLRLRSCHSFRPPHRVSRRHCDPSRTHRSDQDESVEPVGVLEAEPHADAATHAVADVGESVDAERVSKAEHIGGVLLDVVSIVGVGAVAGARGRPS